MATGGEEAPCSSESLMCPLCLNAFDDATLLFCGHTFCRKCLMWYDASHRDRDHMECPLCRSDTKLPENRVDGLPANVTVNGLVHDYHGNRGGLYCASLEGEGVYCTVCAVKGEAKTFCKECDIYMCDNCHSGHQRMTAVFADHHVLSLTEVKSDKFSIHQHINRCPIHKQESKDLFCEGCKVYICFKCVIIAHRDHKIKNQSDIERELRLKVDSLRDRCKARKAELERNIQNTEACRQEVHTAFMKLETEVKYAYEGKSRQLKEKERSLLQNIHSLKKGFDDELDVLKAKDRQRIMGIVNSVSLVENDRLCCLEADNLAAHCLLCDELEQALKEVKDDKSARVISKTAREKVFKPADGSLLHLGEITERQVIEVAQGKKNYQTLRVKKTVNLRSNMWGITAVTQDEVIVGYLSLYGADKVDSQGNTSRYFSQDGHYFDLAHQRLSGNTVVLRDRNKLRVYSQNSFYMHTKHIADNCNYPKISSNHKDEIIIANREDRIMVYDHSVSTNLCSISTKDKPLQAFETRSGAIIASTCFTNPHKLTVYDRNGSVGDTLTSDPGEYLYAAVDNLDRIYVASVNRCAGKVVITQYLMDGLKFRKVFQFEELKLTLGDIWCYMVSLSRNMLAFASGKMLYFIEVVQRRQ